MGKKRKREGKIRGGEEKRVYRRGRETGKKRKQKKKRGGERKMNRGNKERE